MLPHKSPLLCNKQFYTLNNMRQFLQILFINLVFVFSVRSVSGLNHDDSLDAATKKNSPKQRPGLPVLGYVTPWNSRGRDIIQAYRAKFDIVSPVWYTIHTSGDDDLVYEVRGGPPEEHDIDWYKSLQDVSPRGAKPLQVTPRFMLDSWGQDDFRNIVFNETKWHRLSSVIAEVVKEMSYDGVVFESGATQALSGPLGVLSNYLRDEEKTLILVMPPIRTNSGMGDTQMVDAHNSMILGSIGTLANVADYFSIMTYDMSGPGGHESQRQFPANSQLHAAQQEHKVREPGPNTNAEWVDANLKAFAQAAVSGGNSFSDQEFHFGEEITSKFLMGLPLYGYKYPVFLATNKLGHMVRSEGNTENAFAMLRGPGEPVVMGQIEALMLEHEYELLKSDDGEYYFDYSEPDGRWRVFLPTAGSMAAILDSLNRDENREMGAGVALWEVGQTSIELMDSL